MSKLTKIKVSYIMDNDIEHTQVIDKNAVDVLIAFSTSLLDIIKAKNLSKEGIIETLERWIKD
jgi:hypothetical protein